MCSHGRGLYYYYTHLEHCKAYVFFVPTHDFHSPEICEEEVTQEMFREFQYVFQMMKMFVAYSFQISWCFRVFQKVSHKKKPALLSIKY